MDRQTRAVHALLTLAQIDGHMVISMRVAAVIIEAVQRDQMEVAEQGLTALEDNNRACAQLVSRLDDWRQKEPKAPRELLLQCKASCEAFRDAMSKVGSLRALIDAERPS